jgi:hypothetical protein
MNDEFTKLFSRASRSFVKANPELFAAKLERATRSALERKMEGTQHGHARLVVRYRLCRCRSLDPDNAFAATKTLTDLLCRAGLIPGDDPQKIRLEVEQEKVAHRKDQRTEITITWPTNEQVLSI